MLIFMRPPKKGEGRTETVVVPTRPVLGLSGEQIQREIDRLLDGKDLAAGIGNLDEDDPDEP